MTIHRDGFLRQLKALFPELRPRLNNQHGILSLEIHEFASFVQAHIDSQEREAVITAFQFAERLLLSGSADLVSSLSISFLEKIRFEGGGTDRGWAKVLMPQKLSEAHAIMRAYAQS